MQLINLNINKFLLLESFSFTNPYNNIDYLNAQASLVENLKEKLSLLTLAANKIEKFHSFFHFEQSYFHLQLAILYSQQNEHDKAQQQLELAIFQDHINYQAKQLLNGQRVTQVYQRPYINFAEYMIFATEEETKVLEEEGYWKKNDLESIIEEIRYCHLGYHQESAKLYLNRAMVFHQLEQEDLARNDLIKASNLDSMLKEKDYYTKVIAKIDIEVVLCLGSNLGNRINYIQQAVFMLKEEKIIEDMVCSSTLNTKALLVPGSPPEWNLDYLNMAIRGTTQQSPEQLLKSIKNIEKKIGRESNQYWGPREIDIDILAYGEEVIEQEGLKIPHAGLLERPWALELFAAIYPKWRYPIKGPHYQQEIREIYEKYQISGNFKHNT